MIIDEITSILESGDFNNLIGKIENEWLECKKSPYQLDQENQKLELAKDVTALANVQGGIIVIGAETEKNPEQLKDEVTKIHPFAERYVDVERYHNVLKSSVYPRFKDINIKWFKAATDPLEGVLSIIIPPQPQVLFPFLINKDIEETGRNRRIVFGLSERRRANAEPISVEQLHTMIRDGVLFETINKQLESLHEKIDLISRNGSALSTELPSVETFDSRIGLVLNDLSLPPTNPFYILGVTPLVPTEVSDLFRESSNVIKLLRDPPQLRSSGFDLSLDGYGTERIIAGERRRWMLDKWKSLNLWRDGMLIFAAVGDQDFLCWKSPSERLRIHPLAFVESLFLFCKLAHLIYKDIIPPPQKFLFHLQIRNMTINNIPVGLAPGPVGGIDWKIGNNMLDAPDSSKKINLECEGEIIPGVAAYRLAKELYVWFGINEDKIPYSENSDGSGSISEQQIMKLHP